MRMRTRVRSFNLELLSRAVHIIPGSILDSPGSMISRSLMSGYINIIIIIALNLKKKNNNNNNHKKLGYSYVLLYWKYQSAY